MGDWVILSIGTPAGGLSVAPARCSRIKYASTNRNAAQSQSIEFSINMQASPNLNAHERKRSFHVEKQLRLRKAMDSANAMGQCDRPA
jgi:hypothetical protein